MKRFNRAFATVCIITALTLSHVDALTLRKEEKVMDIRYKPLMKFTLNIKLNKPIPIHLSNQDIPKSYIASKISSKALTKQLNIDTQAYPISCEGYVNLAKQYFGSHWNEALIIMKHESSCNPLISHLNSDGSIDRGLFQINSIQKARVNGNLNSLFDINTNFKIASQIFHEQGWNPWSTKKYLNQ